MFYVLGAVLFICGIILPALFGFAVVKRFGGFWNAGVRYRWIKVVSNFLLYSGLPVFVYFLMYYSRPDFQALWLLQPLAFAWVAMLAGGYGWVLECRWEHKARRYPGEWIQNRF